MSAGYGLGVGVKLGGSALAVAGLFAGAYGTVTGPDVTANAPRSGDSGRIARRGARRARWRAPRGRGR